MATGSVSAAKFGAVAAEAAGSRGGGRAAATGPRVTVGRPRDPRRGVAAARGASFTPLRTLAAPGPFCRRCASAALLPPSGRSAAAAPGRGGKRGAAEPPAFLCPRSPASRPGLSERGRRATQGAEPAPRAAAAGGKERAGDDGGGARGGGGERCGPPGRGELLRSCE